MTTYPVIHCRTKFCDFNPDLFMKPSGLDSSDAYRKITVATSHIDSLNGVRYLAFTSGKFAVCGAVMDSFELKKQAGENLSKIENFLRDERGRGTYFFLGVAYETDRESVDVGAINYAELYANYVVPKFEERNVASQDSPPLELSSFKGIALPTTPIFTPHIKAEIYEMGQDEKLFQSAVCKIASERKPTFFCSNFCDSPLVISNLDDVLTAVSADSPTIAKLKNYEPPKPEPPKIVAEPVQQYSESSSNNYSGSSHNNEPENGKKKQMSTTEKVVIAVLTVAIVAVVATTLAK